MGTQCGNSAQAGGSSVNRVCCASDTKGLSICSKGCGSNANRPVVSSNSGCTNRGCEGNKATNEITCNAKPKTDLAKHSVDDLTGNSNNGDPKMTYYACTKQCAEAGLAVPTSSAQVGKAQNTGCSQNGKEIWVNAD